MICKISIKKEFRIKSSKGTRPTKRREFKLPRCTESNCSKPSDIYKLKQLSALIQSAQWLVSLWTTSTKKKSELKKERKIIKTRRNQQHLTMVRWGGEIISHIEQKHWLLYYVTKDGKDRDLTY